MATAKKRRNRRPQKPQAKAKAMWYVSRGFPIEYAAKKAGVHKNSVWKWTRERYSSDRVVRRLAAKIKLMPQHQRDKLIACLKEEA